MVDCKPLLTPLTAKMVPPVTNEVYHDLTHYRALVGSMQYLLFTLLDLAFAVNYVSQFMHSSTDFHFCLVKRILHYVKYSIEYGHHISVNSQLYFMAFSDSDLAGCPLTRRLTTCYVIFLGSNVIA